MGGSLAAAGSRRVALALNEKSFKRLLCFQRIRGDKVKRSKEFMYLPGVYLKVLRQLCHAFI